MEFNWSCLLGDLFVLRRAFWQLTKVKSDRTCYCEVISVRHSGVGDALKLFCFSLLFLNGESGQGICLGGYSDWSFSCLLVCSA